MTIEKQARLVSSARISEIAKGANLIMGEKELLANTAIYLANKLKTTAKAFLEAEEKLEAAEKRIAGLSRAASVNSQWKPDVCPVTGRKFFMWIEHETLGYVPTYGGPFDSYTIPTRDSSGEFSRERYDHDLGGWVGGEFIGLYLIDDDEQCRVCELEERIAELEAKLETADRLQDGAFRDGLKAGFSYGQTDDQSGFMQCMSAYSPGAGIKVEGE